MPSVKQRAADYEAMLAAKNGSQRDPLQDPLKDTLTPPQVAGPKQAIAAAKAVPELTKEQSIEWQIAIRQTYEGPEDIAKLPEWMRPYFAEAAVPEVSKVKDKVKNVETEQSSAPKAAIDKEVAPPPPSTSAAKAPPAIDPNSIWAGVDGMGRIFAAPKGVEIRSSDVIALLSSLSRSAPILLATPGMQGMGGALLSQTGPLGEVNAMLLEIEALSAVPDMDPIKLIDKRVSALGRLIRALGPIIALGSTTPSGPLAQRFMSWVNVRLQDNAIARANLLLQQNVRKN